VVALMVCLFSIGRLKTDGGQSRLRHGFASATNV
jgi:hypothetical protein